MTHITAILTILSAIICVSTLILLPVSHSLYLPDYSEDGNSIDRNASITIGPIHIAVARGGIWLFNEDSPYCGSIIRLEGNWDGKRTTDRIDWSLDFSRYGLEQESYIEAIGQSAGKARFGDFPGIYYRHFEWASCEGAWWTLAISLWYPIAICAIEPGWWTMRKLSAPFKGVLRSFSMPRFRLRTVFIVIALMALILTGAKRVYDWQRQLGSEYKTAGVIREVTQYVESHQGQWRQSWNDLPGGSFESDVVMNFNVTVDDLISDPQLIHRVITPKSGNYYTYPHSERDLNYLRDTMLKMHADREHHGAARN